MEDHFLEHIKMPVITILQLNPLQYLFLFLAIGKKIGKKKGNELIKQWGQSIKNTGVLHLPMVTRQ